MMLKKIVYSIFGENIGAKVRRVVAFACSHKKRINSKYKLEIITCGYHTSCGYYDLDPIKRGKLLVINTTNAMDIAEVKCIDKDTGKKAIVEVGKIANWQQGNRLRWLSRGRMVFNSYGYDSYISVEWDQDRRIEHKMPIYDVKNDKAVTLDFNRLGWLRPGYGYTKFELQEISSSDCAVEIIDFKTDKTIRKILYSELETALGRTVDLSRCYVNHLSFSPSGEKFLFFFIEIQNDRHMCYLGVYSDDKVEIIDKELCASHYTWKNENEILATLYDKQRNCGYYLYDLTEGRRTQIMPQQLKMDGHPTYINEHIFVTDTYPDKAGFQRILLIDTKKETVEECVAIYSTVKHMGVERCDLHPRYAKETNEIYFDADVDGRRRLYSFCLEDVK